MQNEIEFFVQMKIPTVTHQEKKIAVKKGKVVVYEPERLKDARGKLEAYFSAYAPKEAYEGVPLQLIVKWCFPADKAHPHGSPKMTKPDTDNMIKLLKDCFTKLGFWKDDALVASEINQKYYSDVEGIYVKIEVLSNDIT